MSADDIKSAVDFVNLAVERTCYNPQWALIGDSIDLELHENDYKFLAFEVSTFDEGLHLILQMPKNHVEVFASLEAEHPTVYEHDFKARIRYERDSRKVDGTMVEYILNVPIFTYQISELIARSQS